MIGERGPEGERHAPGRRPGCYYGRIEDCCALCALRLVLAPFARSPGSRSDGTDRAHELVGSRVVVPTVDRIDGGEAADYVTGEITVVRTEAEDRDVFAVRSDDGGTLAVTVERID